MDFLNKIHGEMMGAEAAIAVKQGKVSILYGKPGRKMLDEIQMTCKMHGVKSGCIFLIRNTSQYTVRTKGDAARIEQSLMNAVNLC